MARYVMVAFKSNAEAERFIEAIQEGSFIFPQTKVDDNIVYGTVSDEVYVRAVYAKPTQFCECRPEPNYAKEFVRGVKWGWLVHTKCGKPKRNQWQSPRNLLDPVDLATRERIIFYKSYEPVQPIDAEPPLDGGSLSIVEEPAEFRKRSQ